MGTIAIPHKNMSDEMQTQFRQEGEPAFPVEDKEKDNSAESSTVEEKKETSTEQTQSSEGEQNSDVNKDAEGEKNLAEHPRWKEREEDWKTRFNDQEVRHTKMLTDLREEFEAKYGKQGDSQETKTAETTTEIPPWFNGDDQQWQQFQQWNKGLINQAKTELESEQKSKTEAEQKRITEATDFFNTEVAAIEADKTLNPKGEKVDRNKLLKAALDFDLVDSKGRWNYKAAWRFLSNKSSQAQKAIIDEKKQVAGATTSEKGGETKPAPYVTNKDFEKPGARPW